ncbi:helitron_like_N domain-containing protein [Caerostris darwini]|uniref:Helitron_like_N domain-containing protein n=1 Tax=Caerostris darwini TaxID=1538125 RepID=A0AAV4NHH0_9ARAC|nr:helitron_like_N domain-containing protein [Caerostris darwini]
MISGKYSTVVLRNITRCYSLATRQHLNFFNGKDVAPIAVLNSILEQYRASDIENKLKIENISCQTIYKSHKYALVTLKNIFEFAKEKENLKFQALLDNEIFQAICTKIGKSVDALNSGDLINVFRILCYFEVPYTNKIVQSILKKLEKHLNDMNVEQLVFLHYVLSKQEKSDSINVLMSKIPLHLQERIEHSLDAESILIVAQCLVMACKLEFKSSVIEKIISTLSERTYAFTSHNVIAVIYSLLNVDSQIETCKELLNYSFEITVKDLDFVKPKHVPPLLHKWHDHQYYYFKFLDEISRKMDSENWNLKNTWNTMKCFKKLGFCPNNVMDHFIRAICAEPQTFVTDSIYLPLNCARILGITSYRPPRLEEVLTLLCSCEKKIAPLKKSCSFLYIKFVSYLSMLGHFPPHLLTDILDENYLLSVWSKCKELERGPYFENYALTLAWSLENYDQQEKFPFPPAILKSLVQSFRERHVKSNYPLQRFIENGLGGKHFLQTGISTRDGIPVDHVVAMRWGNYPVALHQGDSCQKVNFVEDLNLSSNVKIIAIIAATENQYIRHPEVLTGWMDLRIKYLRKKKFFPVVINYNSWNLLPNQKKTPFLMNQIKIALEEDESERTNS